MAADVQRMGGGDGGGDDPKATKDLLASSFNSQELDLDLHVPFGWEKRLDLKSGRVYLQRCSNNSSSNPCLDHKQSLPKLQDLNFPPSSTHNQEYPSSLALDLKLASSTQSPTTAVYQSVCTLDKVKSALQRAEEEPLVSKKRSQLRAAAWWWNNSPTPSYSSSEVDEGRPVAAGCPGCLSYVLVVTSSPECPRCGTLVPHPPFKKPKTTNPCIDLNISI